MNPLVMLSMMVPGTGRSFNLHGHSIIDFEVTTETVAGLRINDDGTIDQFKATAPDAGYTQIDSATDWVIPNQAGLGYFVRATLESGDTPSGTLGSFIAISGNPEWQLTQTPVGIKTCALTVEISSDSSGSPIVAASSTGGYTLTAENDSGG